ncbi:hypothetical protein [Cohnella sp. GCM10012308]|uniref:hypothetical protein n=1 Tax=Cohnella sp. GCM10012308 TaxID=3317329 RepID=UPI00361414DD
MRRMRYEPPTSHYDERVKDVDARICELIRERKDIAEGKPGYPSFAYIEQWSADYGLYEEHLKSLFGLLYNEEQFKPVVEPRDFIKYIPVLKTTEHACSMFSIISIRQYANASVVTLHIDSSESNLQDGLFCELELKAPYVCTMDSGSGSGHHFIYDFVVSPPLPDELSGVSFKFSVRGRSFQTGLSDLAVIVTA